MIKKALKVSFFGSVLLLSPMAKASVLDSVTNFLSIKKTQAQAAANVQKSIQSSAAEAPVTQTAETTTIDSSLKTSDLPENFDINAVAAKLSAKAETLDPNIVKLGLEAYLKARAQGLDKGQILTIVDYQKPSTQPRLFVFDLKTNNLLFKELVAHGKNSGDNMATSFSNSPSSLKSSLGVFLTSNTYFGHHGYSLRIDGLERGINDMAASRAIVVHAADYVSNAFARAHGRLGKSWGCFAVDPSVSSALISTIKGGTLIFAYYPDQHYLTHSNYVAI